jgi:phosphoglycerate dehydrogenase-like enzyme
LRRYFDRVALNDSKDELRGTKLVEFLADADGVILGTEPFTAEVIEASPCLRYVSKYGVGLNNIDFEAARRCLMEIAYRKGLNSDSVAELTVAFALMLLRRIDDSIQGYRSGAWRKLPGRELAEITIGVIGYGHVGKVVARKFAALGVGRLLANDLLDFPAAPPVDFVPLDYLLAESDMVTVHVDAEKRNRHFVDADFITRMKDGAMFINTSRGTVVDEAALANALKRKKLCGAALDVFCNEPKMNQDFQAAPNLLTTCHIAGSSNRAIKNMGWSAIENLLAAFAREP